MRPARRARCAHRDDGRRHRSPDVVDADLAAAQHISDSRIDTMPAVDHLPTLRVLDQVARAMLDQAAV